MTVSPLTTGGVIPDWTAGNRLRRAREFANLTADQLAEAIGISRNTVSNYEGDKVKPRRATVIAWSLVTGVSLEWLDPDLRPRPNDTNVTRPTFPCLSVVASTVTPWEPRVTSDDAAFTAA